MCSGAVAVQGSPVSQVSDTSAGVAAFNAERRTMAPRSLSGLGALKRDAVRFTVVKCPVGRESIERHPVQICR